VFSGAAGPPDDVLAILLGHFTELLVDAAIPVMAARGGAVIG
jgi:hypothetical protein